MSSGTAGSVHLLGSRINLALVWEASRRDLVRVLGPGESKVGLFFGNFPINALYVR